MNRLRCDMLSGAEFDLAWSGSEISSITIPDRQIPPRIVSSEWANSAVFGSRSQLDSPGATLFARSPIAVSMV